MDRRFLFLAADGAGAVALAASAAYLFALEYRRRAGLPHQHSIDVEPGAFGLDCESVAIDSDGQRLQAWFIPAPETPETQSRPLVRPAIVIVHGWESNRGRSLAHARFLHAAGFHCLALDIRGHGGNPPERLPISAAEFGADTAAAARYLLGRPDVSAVGVVGHSMGGAGALIAAAAEPEIGAVVSLSAPSDPVRLTRGAFRLARLRCPAPLDLPLAWLTARVFLAPRGHSLSDASASAAAARYRGPLLLAHGAEDRAVPVEQLARLAAAAREARRNEAQPERVETLILPGIGHRWLYEVPRYRRTVAAFLASALGGLSPDEAGERAAQCEVERPDNPVQGFGAMAVRARPR